MPSGIGARKPMDARVIAARLFAAAAEAVGAQEIRVPATTVRELRLDLSARSPQAERVIAQCAILRDGQRLSDDAPVQEGDLLDVLPPFAGG